MRDEYDVGEWGLSSSRLTRILWHTLLVVLSIIALVPVIWMFSTSLKPPQEIFGGGLNFIPRAPTIQHFTRLWENYNILRIMYNTLVVALSQTLIQLIVSVLAGYGFAKYNFPLREPLFYLCVATMFIPIQVIMVSNYLMISDWGMVNTFAAVVLPQMANAFGIFLMRQHLRVFPESLLEAARIDGAGEMRVILQIVFPAIKSVIVSLAILFLTTGISMFISLVLPARKMTLPIWLRQFMHAEGGSDWGMLMAASSLGVVPALLAYVLAHRQIMNKFANTGLKG